MDAKNEQLENLTEIRSMMERSTRFLSLSGLSGIFTGIYALAGTAFAYLYLGIGRISLHEGVPSLPDISYESVLWYLLIDACIVLFLSLVTCYFLSRRKARKKGLPLWDRSAKRLLVNMFIPLIAGGILCLILYVERDISLILSLTLIFYGLSLFNAGSFTLDDVRYLGIFEIICGILAAFFPAFGLLFWAIGFGILHIIYGMTMYYKHDK